MTNEIVFEKDEAEAQATVSSAVKTASENDAIANAELVNEAGINIELDDDTVKPMSEEELRARGKKLKIPAAHNMGLEKLAKKIAEKEEELSKEAVAEYEEKESQKAPAPAKQEPSESYTTVIINTSQNPIYLKGDSKEESILIAPREIKTVSKSLLKKLLRSKVVRYWFDKGILTSNYDANETTANEAVAPEHLSQPVERHDGANISASVTKFTKEGSVSINL